MTTQPHTETIQHINTIQAVFNLPLDDLCHLFQFSPWNSTHQIHPPPCNKDTEKLIPCNARNYYSFTHYNIMCRIPLVQVKQVQMVLQYTVGFSKYTVNLSNKTFYGLKRTIFKQ